MENKSARAKVQAFGGFLTAMVGDAANLLI